MHLKHSEKEVEPKKKMWIMNKILLLLILVFTTSFLHAQDVEDKVWSSEKEQLKYKKKDKYEGPDDWYGSNPSDIQDHDYYSNSSNGSSGKGGIQYVPQKTHSNQQKSYKGFSKGGGKGTLKYDPKVKRPDPIEVPEIDPPDIDAPDIDIDAPTIPPGVWKFLLFAIIFIVVVWLVYIFLKNKQPSNKKVVVDVENEWNPEVITKTELELKLDAAIERGDYRECIRIYFTFILKELIKKGWIRWRKEKTNHHYVAEMHGKDGVFTFMQCVRIYDLVWYGEYNIDEEIYLLLKPTLENYYKSLDPTDE